MKRVIHIINASSRTDTGITEALARSLAWMEAPGLPHPRCVTLADGPCGIVTERDSAEAAPAVLRYIAAQAQRPENAGFVVACFSDPGVLAARGLTVKPVVGIGEAGFAAAAALGEMIGTIGVSADRGEKARRLARGIGLTPRLAGHRGLGLDYAALQDPIATGTALLAAGRALRDDGADVLLLAGAGLAQYVAALEDAVGLPVVDPTQAASGLVLAQVMQRGAEGA